MKLKIYPDGFSVSVWAKTVTAAEHVVTFNDFEVWDYVTGWEFYRNRVWIHED